MSSNTSNSSLALTPLGAGDLIDRAVRFYRNNFWTFVWIAAPPIFLGTVFSIGWTILGQNFLNIGAAGKNRANEAFALFFNGFGALMIFAFEGVAVMVVMGGASRNFVRHLLFGESITFRETYRNIKARFFGLLTASFLIVFILGLIGVVFFYLGIILGMIVGFIVGSVLSVFLPLAIVLGIIFGGGVVFGTGWIFFLVASRFAYVPQIMTVEGQGIGAALGRSTLLASGNGMRIYALFIFTIFATIAAMLLLYIPLNWYAFQNGIELFRGDPDAIPAWYVLANQLITQVSLILLAPVLMIGLCLLYVDERVRSEGYDIELMAARNLGDIPDVPAEYANPLQPALASKSSESPPTFSLK